MGAVIVMLDGQAEGRLDRKSGEHFFWAWPYSLAPTLPHGGSGSLCAAALEVEFQKTAQDLLVLHGPRPAVRVGDSRV
jgi:hypothetical protein